MQYEHERATGSPIEENSVVIELLRRQTYAIERLSDLGGLRIENLSIEDRAKEILLPSRVETPDHEALIREISHSLNTPLSQIEAATITFQSGDSEKSVIAAARIRDSIQFCRAFLIAFRQVAHATTKWEPESLAEAVHSAVSIYGDSSESQISVSVDLPDGIRGYSNSFVLALILPLLENAIEASGTAGVVSCEMVNHANQIHIAMRNSVTDEPDLQEAVKRGSTTKNKDDHDGLGLSVVQRLIDGLPGATLDWECENFIVTFTLKIPKRASDE